LRCLLIPPLFPILVLPSYFRYHTMRYKFSEEGVSMSWGILFRHEVILNYARIQDIHLRSNIVERWLGLARILIQTASGSSAAEMTIEGIKRFEELRDFLYSRMRGVKDAAQRRPAAGPTAAMAGDPVASEELAAVLHELATELRALRAAIESLPAKARPDEGTPHV
jgi:putative membrane protein